jgi:IS30 family transposase
MNIQTNLSDNIPLRKSFTAFSDDEILNFQYKINRRPRKLLYFDTPWKVLACAPKNNPAVFGT